MEATPMATLDIFAAAQSVKAPAKATKADARSSFQVEGLSELAAINAMLGTLEGLKETFEAQVKGNALGIYTTEAMRYNKKPDSFNLVDDSATGQYQLRKRSSVSALSEEEVALLSALGVPVEENVKVEEHYFFNPELLKNQKVMAKISAALTKIPELKDEQIVMRQEAQSKTVVADGSIETACKTIKDKDQLSAVLKVIGVSALKTMFDSPEMKDALAVLEASGIKLVPDAAPKAKKAKV
jgi:hypothetical protein